MIGIRMGANHQIDAAITKVHNTCKFPHCATIFPAVDQYLSATLSLYEHGITLPHIKKMDAQVKVGCIM